MVMDPGSFGPEAVSAPGWDGAIRPPIENPRALEDFGSVLAQDARRVPEVQKGLRSMAFDGYVLSATESRIRHYPAEIDRYLGRTEPYLALHRCLFARQAGRRAGARDSAGRRLREAAGGRQTKPK